MPASRQARLLVVGVVALAFTLVGWGTPRAALAQCGGEAPTSPCLTCHEQTEPVCGQGQWHVDHAAQDMCWNCHGGNNRSPDKGQAHVSVMRHPLEDIYTSCYACHPDDYQSLAARYASVLGVTPGSAATPTPRPTVAARPGGFSQAAGSVQPLNTIVPLELWPTVLALLLLLCAALLNRAPAHR